MTCIELKDPASGSSAKILASVGFNCFSWQVTYDDGPRELLWAEPGFESGEKRPSGSGIPLLFPFPGRIGGGEYNFAGRKYLIPHDQSQPWAIHGFVLNRPWRVIDQSESRVTAAFQASVDDPGILNHWPSDFTIEATYELAGKQLRLDISLENNGYDPLPWGLGTHAYFRLPLAEGSAVADTVLKAPIAAEWAMDQMLPTGELLEVPEDVHLVEGHRLGEREFDTPYRLAANSGEVVTTIADPTSGRIIKQSFAGDDFPHLVVYTPGHREAVCMEPYSCVPDPFRLEEQGVETGLKSLAAGQTHRTKVVLEAR